MKYTEKEFIEEVERLYGKGSFEIVGTFKGISSSILMKDKYGILSFKKARQILHYQPTIMLALNKTEYFMNQLKDKYPEQSEDIIPMSEYKNANTKMLFKNRFGVVSITPGNLLAGHFPTIRTAVNRKEYFKNQLLYLYDNKYDFIIESTDRHKGRCTLICPIHGEQSIDNDHIFNGSGCPMCNHGWEKSNLFYLIRLYNKEESFYKLGISHRLKNGKVRRYKEYKNLGYEIEELKIVEFDDFVECKDFETKLKRLIKNNIYMPKFWANENTTECFTADLLPVILRKVNDDLVSTSVETQSINNNDECENNESH